VSSHKESHKQFIDVGATTTLTQDITATKQLVIEQRMALLAEAAKATAPGRIAAGREPRPPLFGPAGAPFGPTAPTEEIAERLIIPPELPKAWAKAQGQGIVIRVLLDGNQLTDEVTAVGRANYLDFYQLLIPIAEANDRNMAAQERLSQALADSFGKSHRVPCPNCHTPRPPTRQVFRAPPPTAPSLRQSFSKLLQIDNTTWRDAIVRFEAATKTMDALVLSSVPAKHPAAEGFTYARDIQQRQEELQRTFPEAIRVPAVFYPKDKWVNTQKEDGKGVEIAAGIPWYFYLTHTSMPNDRTYPEGFSWTLRDLTSQLRPQPQVSYEPGAIERYVRSGTHFASEVPDSLFKKLNNRLLFPARKIGVRHRFFV
jgi:hypothetical protein